MCRAVLVLIMVLVVLVKGKGETRMSRMMYDSMSQLVGEPGYPDTWWEERQQCLTSISPRLTYSLEQAWLGMIQYWEMGGLEGDEWRACQHGEKWFESNCTLQPGIEMAIWEPCNYVSNLAYDRLAVELCSQTDWTMSQLEVNKIAESFALITFGSAFYHGSETVLGNRQDTTSNDLFAFILHQAGLVNVPYNPVLHDLSLTPRPMSAWETVDYWVEMLETKEVTEWSDHLDFIDLPRLQMSFAGMFGHVLLLEFGFNDTITIATPIMDVLGVSEEEQTFFLSDYLPALAEITQHVQLSVLEKAQLLENTLGTVAKLLFAFFWQEKVIDLGGLNLSPEVNTAGAALLPQINLLANNLTLWELKVEDLQLGRGYPGSQGCNDLIPHAKWHLQTAASLADLTKLMDFILYLEIK